MSRRILITLIVLLPCLCFGQASRYDQVVSTINASAPAPGGLYPALYIPNSGIAICTAPANAIPCTNYATTYTSASGATTCTAPAQLTRPGSNTCVQGADGEGGFGAWMKSGNYQYTITTTYGSFGPYDFSVGGSGGGGAGNPGGTVYQIQVNNTTFAGSSVIIPADQFTGATVDAKINACLLAVQSNGGGTCDASGILGGTIVSDPFVGVTGATSIILKMGPGTFTASCAGSNAYTMQPPSNTRITGNGTIIKLAGGSGAFCRIITPVQGAQYLEFDHLTIDGNLANNTNAAVQNHGLFLSDQNNVSVHDNNFRNLNGDGIINEGANITGAVSMTSITGNGTTETVTTTGHSAITAPVCALYTYTGTPTVKGADACVSSYTLISANPFTFSFPSSFNGTIGPSGVVIPQNNAAYNTGTVTDGISNQFFFSLPNLPIQPGSISVTLGSNTYTDNRQQQLIPKSGSASLTSSGCSYTSGLCSFLFGPSYPLSAAANASGGNTVYTGSITNGACLPNLLYVITGFPNAANNGTFSCVSATTTSLTLANTGGVAQSHAGTAKPVPPSGQTFIVSYSSGAQLGITGFQIYNNNFLNINRANISCISCRDGSVHSNNYDQDIQFNPLHWEPDASYQYGSYIDVYDEHYNVPGVGLAITINGQAGNDQQCEHVSVHDVWSRGGQIFGARCAHSSIVNSHVFSSNNSIPIQVNGRGWSIRGNEITALSANALINSAAAGISVGCGATSDMSGSPAGTGVIDVSDNSISGITGIGITVTNCADAVIHHNIIKNVKNTGLGTTANSAWGISVSSQTANTMGGNGVIIDDNIIDDDQLAVINYTVGGGGTVTATSIVNPGIYTVAPTLAFGGACGIAATASLNGSGVGTVTYSNTGTACTPGSFSVTVSGGTGGPTMQRGIYIDGTINNAILSGNYVSPNMLNTQITDNGVGTARIANVGISNTVGGVGSTGLPVSGQIAQFTNSSPAVGNSPIDNGVTTASTITSTEPIAAPTFELPASSGLLNWTTDTSIYRAATNLVAIGTGARVCCGNFAALSMYINPTFSGSSITNASSSWGSGGAYNIINTQCIGWSTNPATTSDRTALCESSSGVMEVSTSATSPNASGSMNLTNLTVSGTCTGCTGAGTVNSVSNSDSTLTVTPTTGAVVASINLGNPNTWTGIQTFTTPALGTPASGVITNLSGTCAGCNIGGSAGTAAAISTNGSGFQVWGMDSGGSVQGWRTPVSSGVTSVATTGPITGGTITSTGTIACATCVTSASSLTNGLFMLGAGSQAAATTAHLDDGVTTASTITSSEALVAPSATFSGSGIPISMGTASNTDLGGQLTLSGGTASYSFTATHTAASRCVATDTTAANAVQVVVTTTTLTINGTSTDVVDYVCVGTTP